MNKHELINRISIKSKNLIPKWKLEILIRDLTSVIMEAVEQDEEVLLVGFGKFKKRIQKEKLGKDPRNGNPVQIASKKIPVFKAGKTFKNLVNDKNEK